MIHTFCKKSAQAKVVDGKLIISCPNAVTPVVWQMDLSSAKASAFEVKDDEGSSQSLLVSRKSGAQKTETIAPFAKKDEAVKALMATSKALENAHGQIYVIAGEGAPAQAAPVMHAAPPKKTSWGKIAAGIIGLLIIFVLIGMIQSMKGYTPGTASTGTASFSGSSNTAGESGVPMSADDFLRQN